MEKLKNINIKIIIRSILVFTFFYCSTLIQYIPIILFHMDLNKIRGNIQAATMLSTFSSVVVAAVLIIIYHKDLEKEFKKYRTNWFKNFDTGFKYYASGLGIMMISNLILFYVLKSGGANNENAVQSMISSAPIWMALQVCILAPFNEEIVFRKTLYDIFKKWKWLFILISFLLFGEAHVINSANSIIDYLYIIPYGVLGGAFALAYSKTESVFTSMTFHMLHNTAIFLLSTMI